MWAGGGGSDGYSGFSDIVIVVVGIFVCVSANFVYHVAKYLEHCAHTISIFPKQTLYQVT